MHILIIPNLFPRSPDLTPLYFYLWSYLKDKVYGEKLTTLEQVMTTVQEICETIPTATYNVSRSLQINVSGAWTETANVLNPWVGRI